MKTTALYTGKMKKIRGIVVPQQTVVIKPDGTIRPSLNSEKLEADRILLRHISEAILPAEGC